MSIFANGTEKKPQIILMKNEKLRSNSMEERVDTLAFVIRFRAENI